MTQINLNRSANKNKETAKSEDAYMIQTCTKCTSDPTQHYMLLAVWENQDNRQKRRFFHKCWPDEGRKLLEYFKVTGIFRGHGEDRRAVRAASGIRSYFK